MFQNACYCQPRPGAKMHIFDRSGVSLCGAWTSDDINCHPVNDKPDECRRCRKICDGVVRKIINGTALETNAASQGIRDVVPGPN